MATAEIITADSSRALDHKAFQNMRETFGLRQQAPRFSLIFSDPSTVAVAEPIDACANGQPSWNLSGDGKTESPQPKLRPIDCNRINYKAGHCEDNEYASIPDVISFAALRKTREQLSPHSEPSFSSSLAPPSLPIVRTPSQRVRQKVLIEEAEQRIVAARIEWEHKVAESGEGGKKSKRKGKKGGKKMVDKKDDNRGSPRMVPRLYALRSNLRIFPV